MKIRREEGQVFVYWVESESEPGKEHCVRWLGECCSCDSFAYNNHKHRATHGRNYECKHMEACKELEWRDIISSVREQLGK